MLILGFGLHWILLDERSAEYGCEELWATLAIRWPMDAAVGLRRAREGVFVVPSNPIRLLLQLHWN
jgi:hypothetical protein